MTLAFVALVLFALTGVAHAEPLKGGSVHPCSVVATNLFTDKSYDLNRRFVVMTRIATHAETLKCNIDTIDTFRQFLETW
jgi:hypothetical protein